ncbi:MAG: hydrogenase 3 maturation endopeptidase HyCI [Candidatus Omnitrophica bacterium]|nr:hydrogenase 3 maturation endopeptidase HyCI [Candidatus Omnitrophota bacterium]
MHEIDTLKSILKGKVVMLCIGNIERGDDGLGPHLAMMIKDKVSFEVRDAGATPENWTGVVTRLKPDTIIMVDAICFEGKPGDVRIFAGEELGSGKISTHDVSLKLLIEYLKEATKANIYMLGIKPVSNEFGRGISLPIKTSLDKLAKILINN